MLCGTVIKPRWFVLGEVFAYRTGLQAKCKRTWKAVEADNQERTYCVARPLVLVLSDKIMSMPMLGLGEN